MTATVLRSWASCRWLLSAFAKAYPAMLVAILLKPKSKFLGYVVKTAVGFPADADGVVQCVQSTGDILQTFCR